jgi:hypothetical protein
MEIPHVARSRWFVDNTSLPVEDSLLAVRTGDIVPVDLNSFLCRNAQIIAGIFTRCKYLVNRCQTICARLENPEKAAEYTEKRDKLVEAIK